MYNTRHVYQVYKPAGCHMLLHHSECDSHGVRFGRKVHHTHQLLIVQVRASKQKYSSADCCPCIYTLAKHFFQKAALMLVYLFVPSIQVYVSVSPGTCFLSKQARQVLWPVRTDARQLSLRTRRRSIVVVVWSTCVGWLVWRIVQRNRYCCRSAVSNNATLEGWRLIF